jgi:hypothetical protein
MPALKWPRKKDKKSFKKYILGHIKILVKFFTWFHYGYTPGALRKCPSVSRCIYSGFHYAPGTGWATPQGTAARGKSAGRGRGAIFAP